MILKITRKSIANGNVIKTFESKIIDVNQLDLDFVVISYIKKMINVNNKHYELIGSDTKCVYLIEPVSAIDINEFKTYANKYINDGINKYNEIVDSNNVAIKACNKKNNRPITTGLLKRLTEISESGTIIAAGGDILIK